MPDLTQLTKQLHESFGLHMPTDIWESVYVVLDPGLREANMMAIRADFPMALYDSIGLTEASLAAMANEWYGITPRLDFMARSLSPLASHVSEIDEYFVRARATHDAAAQQRLNALNLMRLTQDYVWNAMTEVQQDNMRRNSRITLSAMLDKNLSQTVRLEQEEAWKSNKRAFFVFANNFRKWCDANGIRYALRHPITMNNNFFHTLESVSELAGIPLPAMYYTLTQSMVLEDLDDLAHEGLFFDTIQQRTGPHAKRWHAIYQEWTRLNAYANVDWPNGAHTSIVPACLPPWLLRVGDSVLPIYLMNAQPTFSFAEQSVTYRNILPEFIGSESSMPQPISEEAFIMSERISAALSILCIGVTLFASTIRLGSGHRRPAWIRTPMNRVLLNSFTYALEQESKHYV